MTGGQGRTAWSAGLNVTGVEVDNRVRSSLTMGSQLPVTRAFLVFALIGPCIIQSRCIDVKKGLQRQGLRYALIPGLYKKFVVRVREFRRAFVAHFVADRELLGVLSAQLALVSAVMGWCVVIASVAGVEKPGVHRCCAPGPSMAATDTARGAEATKGLSAPPLTLDVRVAWPFASRFTISAGTLIEDQSAEGPASGQGCMA